MPASTPVPASKATKTTTTVAETAPSKDLKEKKGVILEDDDEFEDFPAQGKFVSFAFFGILFWS